jgi:proline iminopeptidase
VRVQLNAKRIWFDTIGSSLADEVASEERPTILALHGGPGIDHSSVRQTVEPLADLGQILLIDQCGHGRSDYGQPSDWNIESWASDVAELCDVLEVQKPILFGSSFGAMVALAVAGMFPELPSGLVISNSGAGLIDHEATREAFRRLGGDNVAEIAWRGLEDPSPETSEAYNEVCLRFYSHRPGAAEFAKFLLARAIRTPEVGEHFQSTIKSLQPSNYASAVRCRTLILCGADDVMVPESVARSLHDLFPYSVAELEFIPDAGHFLYRDNPDYVYRVLRSFVART